MNYTPKWVPMSEENKRKRYPEEGIHHCELERGQGSRVFMKFSVTRGRIGQTHRLKRGHRLWLEEWGVRGKWGKEGSIHRRGWGKNGLLPVTIALLEPLR